MDGAREIDMQGKVCLVTGATAGIGQAAAKLLGQRGGTVVGIGRNPAKNEASKQMIQELTGKSAPIEVRVKLIPDPSTPSGFKWSSSEGPPMKVFSGTICSGNVTVETKKPISYVLPLMRKTVGVS